MDTVAFIGLGIMGRPMAKNLLKAGYALRVYARRKATLDAFDESAAVVCSSPAEAGKNADFCITMISDTPDVEEVILGDNGLIKGVRENSIIIDMSTISAQATRVIADRLKSDNIQMLDAPVSGGEIGAIEGTLSIMVGGDAESFQRAHDLFKVLGKNIIHVGNHGAGQIVKACNQLQVAQTIASTAEAIEFASTAGVDPQRMREALLGGFAYSRILETHGLRMLTDDYVPGFKASLHLKDLRIAQRTARDMQLHLPGLEKAVECMGPTHSTRRRRT